MPRELRSSLHEVRKEYKTDAQRQRLLNGIADAESKGFDRTALVFFVWTLRGLTKWLHKKGGIRRSLWESAKFHEQSFVSRRRADHQDYVKLTRVSHAYHWATTFQSLISLGLALQCGKKSHSLRIWRLIEPAIFREALRIAQPKDTKSYRSRAQTTDRVFELSERVRLGIAYQFKTRGRKATKKRAEEHFRFLHTAFFPPHGIHLVHPHPKDW